MNRRWLTMEHYRLHCVERWPYSPHKQAVIVAIHSALESLRAGSPAPLQELECSICTSRVLEFGDRSHDSTAWAQLAA
jgi:hypothetical protein